MTDAASQRSSKHLELTARVRRMRPVFDVDKIVASSISSREIVKYYKRSSIGYSLVHSRDGSIHMSLSRDGRYDPQGYDVQVDMVSQIIACWGASRVVELGCGRGFNLMKLARSWPRTEFVGIDLSPDHVNMAQAEAKALPNVHVQVADFESLPMRDQQYDLAYSIESICHARNPLLALTEASRVVAPGGRLMVVDAWRTDKVSDATPNERDAVSLTEKSMAVGQAVNLTEWLQLSTQAGWTVSSVTDLSREVMPNLERFERLADAFLRRRLLAKAVTWLLPHELTNNVVAGYLMAQSVRQGFHTYGVVLLDKSLKAGPAVN